ncbi:hypothetical protein EVAR_97568_1 [Eumeta japonica]|uniref:Uncharacterized protein n=1 Tax=Eumeta variegata TaxID=151549 RepID=A0A4C1WS70_EUMVA|nr:hypothetical protein EVAR_97568_1 [Eumeta japonica]
MVHRKSLEALNRRLQDLHDNTNVMGEECTYPLDENTGQITLTHELYNVVETPEQLINEVYPSIAENYTNAEWLREQIIDMKNDLVNGIKNIINIIQEMIPGEQKI